jgi:hypothetical protein
VQALIKTNVAATMIAHAILHMPFVSIDEDTAWTGFRTSQVSQSYLLMNRHQPCRSKFLGLCGFFEAVRPRKEFQAGFL